LRQVNTERVDCWRETGWGNGARGGWRTTDHGERSQ
jgi:hypothetical protein